MIEAFSPDLTAPPAHELEVRKRRRSKNREPRRRSGTNAALFVGAIVVLTGDDGEPYDCQLTHQTPDGQWWCVPLAPK